MSESLRYGTNSQNTSKYMQDLLNQFIKMPKGVFNLNRRKIQDVSPYAITPIESWEMLPNSDVYLKYDIQMLSKNPTVKRMLSGMTAELRVYKVNYNDCWEGWNNFITKGRSGKVSKSIPYVDLSLGSDNVTTSLPYNPMESMRHAPAVFLAKGGEGGINKFTFDYNVGVKNVNSLENSGKTGIDTIAKLKSSTAMRVNALPYVAYNKIVKEYQNSNLLQSNPHWYPEDENHDQILPYEASGPVTTSDYNNPNKSFVHGKSHERVDAVNSGSDENPVYESYPWLNVLQYSQRKGDYFNTGSPFPDLLRGDVPTISPSGGFADFSEVVRQTGITKGQYIQQLLGINEKGELGVTFANSNSTALDQTHLIFAKNDKPNNIVKAHANNTFFDIPSGEVAYVQKGDSSVGYLLKDVLNRNTIQGLQISMANWRYLATMTVLRERLALTDGSYNELIKAMFGHNPKWHAHNPIYCGGSRQPIVFSEVVNTAESASAPLGDIAGRAVSASSNDVIHVHSDDYGCFITVLVITPDEYYSQGADKMWTRLENAEQYMPILNNLSPDATLNKELYISGNNAVDEDVFNHQERFAYYKSRRNEVSGLLGLAVSKIGDLGTWVMQRLFSSTPQFNAEFNRGELTDNEKAVFASTNQAQFNVVIGSNMRFIAPIPEDSRPSDLGISY